MASEKHSSVTHAALLLLDIRKAFDTVSHKILLRKPCHYGIRGPALTLIQNYLFPRSQIVSVNNCNSSSKPVTIAVPQGAILGFFDLRERLTQCHMK